MLMANLVYGRLPERTNGAASKAVVASGSPWVQIPYLPPLKLVRVELAPLGCTDLKTYDWRK